MAIGYGYISHFRYGYFGYQMRFSLYVLGLRNIRNMGSSTNIVHPLTYSYQNSTDARALGGSSQDDSCENVLGDASEFSRRFRGVSYYFGSTNERDLFAIWQMGVPKYCFCPHRTLSVIYMTSFRRNFFNDQIGSH